MGNFFSTAAGVMLKQAFQKGATDGLFSTLEEMTETLTTPQIEQIVAMLQRVLHKRKTTVEMRAK